MKNKSRSVSEFRFSRVSRKTCFTQYFFTDHKQIRQLRELNIAEVKLLPLRLVVDKDGNLSNPKTPVVFFLN